MKKLKIIVCIFVSLLLVACGEEEQPPIQYMEDTIMEKKGLPPIELRGNGSFTKDEVDKFINSYVKKQPEQLLMHVVKIVVCDNKTYQELAASSTSTAFANPNEMVIYTKIDINKKTLTHELMHIFDYVEGYHHYSESDEFKSLYEAYKGTFHFYNNKEDEYDEEELLKYDAYFNASIDEFFAECGQLYLNDGNYLKKSSQAIFDYFSNILEK